MSFATFANPEFELTPSDVASLHSAGEIEIFDIREQYERDAGHIDGSHHIEIERISGRSSQVPRDRRIVFHCRLGIRGAMVAAAFRSVGFDAWNMVGGIQAWNSEGLPMVPDGATVADH